jgi:amino acid adenylation domain-containing protein
MTGADETTPPEAEAAGPEQDEADAVFRLSPQQERLFLNHPEGVPCLSLTVRLNGVPDEAALEAKWTACVEALEILRTACRTPAWSRLPLQHVEDHLDAPLIVERLSDDAVAAHLAALEQCTVDPASVPNVHARLIIAPSAARLHLSGGAHLVDGDSLITLAHHLIAGTAEEATPASEPLQYPDIAEWAASLAEDADAGPGLAFWRNRVSELQDTSPLFPHTPPSEGGRWSEAAAGWPEAWSTSPPSEPEAIALALVFAARCGGNARVGEDGAAVAVRSNSRDVEDLFDTIGPLARWLPLVTRTDLDAPFSAWCAEVEIAWNTTRTWQHLMEAGIGEQSVPEIAIGVDYVQRRRIGLGGNDVIEHCDPEPSAPPLILRIDVDRRRLSLLVDTGRHDPAQAARLARMASMLADAARKGDAADTDGAETGGAETGGAETGGFRAGSLPWLDDATRAELIAMGTGPALTVSPDPLPDRVARYASETPDAAAVIQDGRAVTYGELWARAGAVADTLSAGSFEDERPAAVRFSRGPDALAAMLGAWRAGRPYTLCDPALPQSRIDEMLRAANAAATVTEIPAQSSGPEAAANGSGPTAHRPDLAYLLFTSGSTGTPKAVAVTQAGLAASTAARTQHYGADPKTFLVVSPLGFDSSVAGLYWTLGTGGTVVLPTDVEAQDAAALARLIRVHAISHVLMLPGLYDAVLEAAEPGDLDSLELVIVAGEECAATLPKRHRTHCPGARLENEYGPTEGTVWCTAARLDDRPDGRVTIGSAIPGVSVRVLDPMLHPVPPGVPGEIAIGGAGLARGYHGRPSETAARFVPDPLSTEPGARIYLVGDRGVLSSDGQILYQGRVDNQVKIRGHRVELEEIEAHLLADARVRSAAAAVRDGHLVAYLVLRDGEDGDLTTNAAHTEALTRALSQGLPDWMTPQSWVVLEELPRGATGKLDRAALPDPDQARPDAASRPPRDEIERAVADVWAELLKVEEVGIDDNFFHLGGDSLVALRVSTRMRQLGINARPRLLLKHPTIAELIAASPRLDPESIRRDAPVVEAQGAGGAGGTPEASVPLTALQEWLLDRAGGIPKRYNQTLRIRASEPLDLAALERAFHDVVQRHDALRLRIEAMPTSWRQVAGPAETVPPLLYDLSRVPKPARATIEAGGWERLHSDLDPSIGRNARLAVVRRGADAGDLVLAVVHHLSIDAASWQVVIEDLETAYRAALAGKQPNWPHPAGSFTAWAAATQGRQPDDPTAPKTNPAPGSGTLPVDHPNGSNREADVECLSVSLDEADTDNLTRLVPGAFGCGLDALLTAALAETLADWSGNSRVRIDRERHGRDTEEAGSTVGWFTAIEPITFEVPPDTSPAATPAANTVSRLKALVDQADAEPPAGAYGGAGTGIGAEGEVLFNFLGRTDLTTREVGLFQVEAGPVGRTRDPEIPRHCLLEIDAEIFGGQLKIDWNFARPLHDRSTIERLAADHLARLSAIAKDLAKNRQPNTDRERT